jgi:hypothetical protein
MVEKGEPIGLNSAHHKEGWTVRTTHPEGAKGNGMALPAQPRHPVKFFLLGQWALVMGARRCLLWNVSPQGILAARRQREHAWLRHQRSFAAAGFGCRRP